QVMMVSLAVTARHPILHFASLAPALIPVLVLLLGLDVYCLVDLARAKSVRNAPKLAWGIVILCVSAPLGAILSLFFGMVRTVTGPAEEVGVERLGPGGRPAGAARDSRAGHAPRRAGRLRSDIRSRAGRYHDRPDQELRRHWAVRCRPGSAPWLRLRARGS